MFRESLDLSFDQAAAKEGRLRLKVSNSGLILKFRWRLHNP